MYSVLRLDSASWKTVSVSISALIAASLLVGCGGGGGGGGAPPTGQPPVNADTASLQGIWQSPAAASTASTILLPNLTMWTVVTEGTSTRVSKATLNAQGTTLSGSGKTFSLGSSGSSSSTFIVTGTEKMSLSQTITTGSAKSTYTQTYQSRYDSPASLADFAKVWIGTVGAGRITWTVSSSGTISGTSTTGCTYTGKLTERTERKAVVDVSISEICTDVTATLSGLATISSDKARLSVVATTTDENSAAVLSLTVSP